jgi:predicted TIM-barrel fold metal-dependent hydrolase
LRIIRELIEFEPKSKKTDLSQALKFLSSTQKKKAIVFVISDFMVEDDYEKTLKIAGKKYDITGVRVYDIREEKNAKYWYGGNGRCRNRGNFSS